MKDLRKAIEKYKNFENNEDHVDKFLDTLDSICVEKREDLIDDLFKCFYDETDYLYVTQAIIHSLESFEMEIYLDALIRNFEYLVNNSPESLDMMLNRIFNDSKYKASFLKRIYLLKKEKLKQALEVVKEFSPHHKDFCNTLIKSLKQSP